MTTQRTVDHVLAHPEDFKWSIQGLGMLRTYLDPEGVERLHIWDPDMAVDDVSTLHDHPWDFESTVFYGTMGNVRFQPHQATVPGIPILNMQHSKIQCGEGGGLRGDTSTVLLDRLRAEKYAQGESYSMEAPEIHESYPTPGTVTVIRRKFHADRELANVYWEYGNWVTAEPRPATQAEVEHFISLVREYE